MITSSWSRLGIRLFRPDGGLPYLERICGRLLSDYLDEVRDEAEGQPGAASLAEDLVPFTGQRYRELSDDGARSVVSLLLHQGRVAGFWVRFGTDFPVPRDVDTRSDPPIVSAALGACRLRTWAQPGERTTASQHGGWRWQIRVVLEWPAPLLTRARTEVQRALGEPPARLPVGGSALSIVRGELSKRGFVERGHLSPLPASAMLAALAGFQAPAPSEAPEPAAPTPPEAPEPQPAPPPAPGDDSPGGDDFGGDGFGGDGFGDDGFGGDAGFLADPGFGLEATDPELRVPEHLLREDEAGLNPDGEDEGPAPVVPWERWLDELAGLAHDDDGDEDARPLLFEVDDGDELRPARLMPGWIAPDLRLVPWGGPRGLGDRSSLADEFIGVMSGLSGSLALVGMGMVAAVLVGLLLRFEPTPVPQPRPVEPIPTVSFCSASNPAFMDALHCWSDRLASPEPVPWDERCDLAPPDLSEVRSQWCGLLHRGPRADSLADQAMARACFQVLGRPDQYATDDGLPNVESFFLDPSLQITELVELRGSLASECDRCDQQASARVRRLSALSWVGPSLRTDALGLANREDAELDVCKVPRSGWDLPADSEVFPYATYRAARFGPLAYDTPVGPPRSTAEWTCFEEARAGTGRARIDTELAGVKLVAPPRFDAEGGAGLISQLGLHGLLAGELGSRDEGALACAQLAQQELSAVLSVHPLYGGEEPDFGELCGQVCAGYFELADRPGGWRTYRPDLDLCVYGRASRWAPERACREDVLHVPRTEAERRTRDFVGLGDASDLALADCRRGAVEEDGPPLADEKARISGVSGVFFRPDEVESEPARYSLPEPVLSCSLQLITQAALVEQAKLPVLLPEGSIAADYPQSLENVAGRLAEHHRSEQRSRRVCEELSAACYTASALLVKRPELVWEDAVDLATVGTGEDLAVAMGTTLERLYRERCDDGQPSSTDEAARRASCSGGWRRPEDAATCAALCESSAPNYYLPARYADRPARLDAAFRLASQSYLCVGLQDLWNAQAEDELTWESACLLGMESRRTAALELLVEDDG